MIGAIASTKMFFLCWVW